MSKRYLPRRKLQDNFLLGRKFPILTIIWNKLETFSSVLKNLFFLSAKCQFNLKKNTCPYKCVCSHISILLLLFISDHCLSHRDSCRKHLIPVSPSFSPRAELDHKLYSDTTPRKTFRAHTQAQVQISAWFSKPYVIWDQCTLLTFPPGMPLWFSVPSHLTPP